MTDSCPVCGKSLVGNEPACPACGFKLLGSTQQFAPVGAADIAAAQKAPALKTARLTIIRGPQIGMAYELGSAVVSIGRTPDCDIFLNDMTVSRQHASITPLPGGGYIIVDENSYNGVWVRNFNIDEYQLVNGDVVQIGVFCLRYEENWG